MYNPYDMLEIRLNGIEGYARPVEFDSDLVDHKTMKNAFGTIVKPTKAVTTCNKCGQGFTFNLRLSDPPFGRIEVRCELCSPTKVEKVIAEPFVNPVKTKRVLETELDPLINRQSGNVEIPETTVAERMATKAKEEKPRKEKK